jgi:hypothetical protein
MVNCNIWFNTFRVTRQPQRLLMRQRNQKILQRLQQMRLRQIVKEKEKRRSKRKEIMKIKEMRTRTKIKTSEEEKNKARIRGGATRTKL